jgi:hypothetical protein
LGFEKEHGWVTQVGYWDINHLRENECEKAEEREGVKNWSRVQRRAKKKRKIKTRLTLIKRAGWCAVSKHEWGERECRGETSGRQAGQK